MYQRVRKSHVTTWMFVFPSPEVIVIETLPKREGFKKLGTIGRKTISLSQGGLVTIGHLEPEQPLPLLIRPAVDGVNLSVWAANNRELIESHLLRHGGILFRNFKVTGPEPFEQFMESVSGQLLEYSYRSTPRSQVHGRIYTSTEYPAEHSIPLHNEMAYTTNWPMKIGFFCLKPADQGGATPIADSRRVFDLIDPKIKERFAKKKVMYVRNYGEGLDLSWQNVFQTEDRSEVESYCRNASIDFEWKGSNRLTTRQICQAIASHPKNAETVWFNQAHLFHVSSLPMTVRDSLLATFAEDDLPRHAFYGDGAPIESSALNEIRAAYEEATVTFSWQAGDVLLLDNMLAAHGRRPFTGIRKVLVGMAESFRSTYH